MASEEGGPERLTLDTNLLLELWKNQERRSVVEEILRLSDAGDVDLAVTATIARDVPRDPLASRLRELPDLGVTMTGTVARFGTWVLGRDMLGDEAFERGRMELIAALKPGDRRLPQEPDWDHLHAHKLLRRDVFLTWDKEILAISGWLLQHHDIVVQRPEDYLSSLTPP